MRPRTSWWMRRTRAETGAVAVVVSVSMALLAVTAALVLDFGIARLDRTSNKLTADASVMAGLQAMYDTEGERKSWRAVCTAISYLRANGPELTTATGTFTTGTGGAVGGDPCTTLGYQDLTCLPDDQSTWARWDGTAGDGRITIQIRSGYLMPDPAFTEDATLSADTGVADAAGCDQLAVIIRESRSPGLGALATDEDTVTTIRSVGRASSDGLSDVVPALILLERTECNALQVGSGASYIEVYGSGAAPGTIHADSLGSGSTCSSGSGSYVMRGKAAKHIWAHAATSGSPRRPGLITTVASSGAPGAVPARATDGASNTCAETLTGTCTAAVGGSLIGRRPPDVRYLSGVRNAVAAADPAVQRHQHSCGIRRARWQLHVRLRDQHHHQPGLRELPQRREDRRHLHVHQRPERGLQRPARGQAVRHTGRTQSHAVLRAGQDHERLPRRAHRGRQPEYQQQRGGHQLPRTHRGAAGQACRGLRTVHRRLDGRGAAVPHLRLDGRELRHPRLPAPHDRRDRALQQRLPGIPEHRRRCHRSTGRRRT